MTSKQEQKAREATILAANAVMEILVGLLESEELPVVILTTVIDHTLLSTISNAGSPELTKELLKTAIEDIGVNNGEKLSKPTLIIPLHGPGSN